MRTLKVGVLGSGDVGRVLASGFIANGHAAMIGTRDPAKLTEWANAAGKDGAVGSFRDAASFGDVIVLATLGTGTESAIQLTGVENFAGKVVIDATNPLDFSTGAPRLSIGHTDSLGEQVQRWLPDAKVVKAFNTVGNAHMVNPRFTEGRPDMFLCGNDAEAKSLVSQICEAFGWGSVDLGGIEASRYLEPLCMVWVLYGIRSGSWNHAFKLVRS